jgi:hypothetical protein
MKAARENHQVTYKGKSTGIMVNFAAEIKSWEDKE